MPIDDALDEMRLRRELEEKLRWEEEAKLTEDEKARRSTLRGMIPEIVREGLGVDEFMVLERFVAREGAKAAWNQGWYGGRVFFRILSRQRQLRS